LKIPTVTRPGRPPAWFWPTVLAIFVLLVAVACFPAPTPAPGASAAPTPTPSLPPAAIPLAPANPDNLFGFVAWLFTPIFQIGRAHV